MSETQLRLRGVADVGQVTSALNGIQKQMASIGSLSKTVFGSLIGIETIRRITEATSEVSKLGASLGALDVSAKKAGTSANALISSLQSVTKGQVAVRDLAVSVNTAIALLGTESIPLLSELASIAGKASTTLGTDLTQAFADIVKGIGRQSKLILDNLGIIIDAEAAYINYAVIIGKTADALTEAEKKQAFLNETIKQGREKFGDIEAVINPIAQMKATLTDLGDILADIFVRAGGVDIFKNITFNMKRISDALRQVGRDANSLIIIKNALLAIIDTAITLGLVRIITQFNGLRISVLSTSAALRANSLELVRQQGFLGNLGGLSNELKTALTGRIGRLKAERVALLAAVPAWGAYIAQITATLGIFALLFIAYQRNERAQRELNNAVEDAEKVYSDIKGQLYETGDAFRDINTTLSSVKSSSQLTQGQIDFLRESVVNLKEKFPGLIEQLGYGADANGVLYDSTGTAVTGLDNLQAAVNSFNTQNIINETARAIESFLLLSSARLKSAAGPEPIPIEEREAYIISQLDKQGLTGWDRFMTGQQMRTSEFMLPDIGFGLRGIQEGLFGTTTQAIEEADRQNKEDFEDLLAQVKSLGVKDTGGISEPGAPPGARVTIELTEEEKRLEEERLRGIERTKEFSDAERQYQDSLTLAAREYTAGLIDVEQYNDKVVNSMSDFVNILNELDIEKNLTEPHASLLTVITNALVEASAAALQFADDLKRIQEVERRFIDNIYQDIRDKAEEMNTLLGESSDIFKKDFRIEDEPGSSVKDSDIFSRFFMTPDEMRAKDEAQVAKDALKDEEKVNNQFLDGLADIFNNFASQMGDVSELLGGGPLGELGNQALTIGSQLLGNQIAGNGGGFTDIGSEGFASAFQGGAAAGGFTPEALAAQAAMVVVTYALGRIFGEEKPLKLDGPVDVRITDISPRLTNFFNFKGLNPYSSRFYGIIEGGLY